jgi:hypothetical protein
VGSVDVSYGLSSWASRSRKAYNVFNSLIESDSVGIVGGARDDIAECP